MRPSRRECNARWCMARGARRAACGERRAAEATRELWVCASARVVVRPGKSRRAPSVGGSESRASSRTTLPTQSLYFYPHTCYRSGFVDSHAFERGSRFDLAARFRLSAISPRATTNGDRLVLVQAVTAADPPDAYCDSDIVIFLLVRMCSDGWIRQKRECTRQPQSLSLRVRRGIVKIEPKLYLGWYLLIRNTGAVRALAAGRAFAEYL